MAHRRPRRDSAAFRIWRKENRKEAGRRGYATCVARYGLAEMKRRREKGWASLQAKRAAAAAARGAGVGGGGQGVDKQRVGVTFPRLLVSRIDKAAAKCALSRTGLLEVMAAQWLDGYELNQKRSHPNTKALVSPQHPASRHAPASVPRPLAPREADAGANSQTLAKTVWPGWSGDDERSE